MCDSTKLNVTKPFQSEPSSKISVVKLFQAISFQKVNPKECSPKDFLNKTGITKYRSLEIRKTANNK